MALWTGVVKGQDVCNVCGENGVMTLEDETYGADVPCSNIKQLGLEGQLGPANGDQCANVQVAVRVDCGCQTIYTGEVVVVLLNATTIMSPAVVEEFEFDVAAFFDGYFDDDLFQETSGWTANLTFQDLYINPLPEDGDSRKLLRRRLMTQQAPLETRTTVSMMSPATVSQDFETLLKNTLEQFDAEFIASLKASEKVVNRVFFRPLETVEVFGPDEEITTERVDAIDTDLTFDPDPVEGSTSKEDTELDKRTIAGIAAAAGFVFILIAGIMCVICRGNEDDEEEMMKANSSFGNSLATPQQTRSVGGSGAGMSSGRSSASGSRYRSSRALGTPRSSSTRIVSADGRTVTVLSNSEQGLERKIDLDEVEEDDDGYTPVFEEEHRVGTPEGEPESRDGIMSNQDQGSYQEREDQGSYDESYQDSRVSTQGSIETPATPVWVTREITAPPGKLGIVIETTLDGPVVHKINESSPLVGVVLEGDLITAIDDVDTRAMSASAITALMVRTAEKYRRMTVKSEQR